MRAVKLILSLVVVFWVAACADNRVSSRGANEITAIQVNKSARTMYLLNHSKVVKTYKIGLGFTPVGHKALEGDGRTPEGLYFINRRNPNSRYHLSLGISYPNARDVQVARAAGARPGGDIFIHGNSNLYGKENPDWTAGCIAVDDREMDEIFSLVKTGTPIRILP